MVLSKVTLPRTAKPYIIAIIILKGTVEQVLNWD